MSTDDGVTEVFAEIVALAQRLGVRSIKDLPGCWEVQVDDAWWFAVNGHAEPMKDSRGHVVPPYYAVLEFNGWPAGFVSPLDGHMAAGEAANEETLLRALRACGGTP